MPIYTDHRGRGQTQIFEKNLPLEKWLFRLEYNSRLVYVGARGSVVVKALCYKPEGRGFDNR
jgi:hypothetical protein